MKFYKKKETALKRFMEIQRLDKTVLPVNRAFPIMEYHKDLKKWSVSKRYLKR